MKKFILTFSCLALFATFSYAQLIVNGSGGGTVTLDVNPNGAGDQLLIQNSLANGRTVVRVGPTGTDTRAFVNVQTSSDASNTGYARLGARTSYAILSAGNSGTPATKLTNVGIELDTDGSATDEAFVISTGGFLGDGVMSAGEKVICTIDGNGITTTEAKVQATVTAPDYVFQPEYNLRSLEEVEAYINENSHLPEIPSAAEFAENGITLGKMSFDLLKKVEELTLYMIEMKKENEALKARVNELENK